MTPIQSDAFFACQRENEWLREQLAKLKTERDEWKKCAESLRVFAPAYRPHPNRNPEYTVDAVLAEFDRLAKGQS